MIRRAALAAITAVALTLTGCSPGPLPVLSDLPPNQMSGLDIPDGRIDEAVSKVDGLAGALMAGSGIPGMAIAVVHGGETVYAKGFGVRNASAGDGDSNRVDADTVFQLAALSTSIGATVVAQQVTEKVIDWDTPIAVHLPWFALSDPYVTEHVTVADLYSQRAGLPRRAGYRLADLGYGRRQVLQRLKELPLSPFRITYDDNDFGITAAAEAVAAAAGKSWEELSADVLYRSLGMGSTSSHYADFTRRRDRALSHVKTEHGYRPSYHGDTDPRSPAAGVSSTVNDLARWLAMVLADGTYDGKRIASPDALAPALTPQVIAVPAAAPGARAEFYGHGFTVSVTSSGRTAYGNAGGLAFGSSAAFAMLPSEDVGIVVLTNAAPAGIPETLVGQFLDLVQYGEIRSDWANVYRQQPAPTEELEDSPTANKPPTEPDPAGAPRGYTGEYFNDYWGTATVTEQRGRLELSLGPRRQKFVLTHWSGDVFTFTPKVEDSAAATISKATFTPDTLTLEYYDRDNLGIFFR